MGDPAVQVQNLEKVYRVYAQPWHRLLVPFGARPRHREFRAVDGVTFDLPRGQGLAIVGENGAGKSTLLKILAGITAPSAGRSEVRGKIASILELGSGFHPEFTGRQNIVLNAAMLGLSELELREKTPAILDFAELGEFIDQPVKVYSTGMAMRLGFAIATQIEPDVLIIDEALSVGDGYFQKKCMDRLERFVGAGGTLLFCSHAMYYVSAFCQQALWLRNGRPQALGPVLDVIHEYENFLVAKSGSAASRVEEPVPALALDQEPVAIPEQPLVGPARLIGVRQVAGPGAEMEPARYASGSPFRLEVSWVTDDPTLGFHLGVGINRIDGVEVCSFSTRLDGLAPVSGERSYRTVLEVPALPMVKGEFSLYVFLLDHRSLHVYDQRLLRAAFRVESPDYRIGLVNVEHAWDVQWSGQVLLERSPANDELPA
ncbi:MAG TPA: ABC transporter ATP-binding protein [Thermoanaerobaculia bacterium]|jgi:ABC-type polysaccharide/polyol phosphate transport system ATPase subunit|nr:ABC transporter ATP-binding protein [Thermoanaerobaculia bacterium]